MGPRGGAGRGGPVRQVRAGRGEGAALKGRWRQREGVGSTWEMRSDSVAHPWGWGEIRCPARCGNPRSPAPGCCTPSSRVFPIGRPCTLSPFLIPIGCSYRLSLFVFCIPLSSPPNRSQAGTPQKSHFPPKSYRTADRLGGNGSLLAQRHLGEGGKTRAGGEASGRVRLQLSTAGTAQQRSYGALWGGRSRVEAPDPLRLPPFRSSLGTDP